MTRARRVAFLTGSRADYGLLSWVITAAVGCSDLTTQILVTGSHLDPGSGFTADEIRTAGAGEVCAIPTMVTGDSAAAVAKSIGLTAIGCADALERLRPDAVVLLGDRYEVLAAAQAALVATIPIAHIGGGECTTGAFDESIRHAMTKLSALHFVSTETYRNRVVQMGEDPQNVYTVGALGVDAARRVPRWSREALQQAVGHPLSDPVVVVTYHPETLSTAPAAAALEPLFAALRQLPVGTCVFTGANADPGGHAVNTEIRAFVHDATVDAHVVPSLGQPTYVNLVRHAALVVGNSSSGIIEAPALGTPTVNIGSRQDGRVKPASVIDCGTSRAAIAHALRLGLAATAAGTSPAATPYDHGGASEKIIDVLRRRPLNGLTVKTFHRV